MSARYPHYVYYFPQIHQQVYVANAENEEEALQEFRHEHGQRAVVDKITTTLETPEDT